MTDRAGLFASSGAGRLVVKVGSSLLIEAGGGVRRHWPETLVADLAVRHKAGQKLILVSSGAIALGSRRLKLAKGGRGTLEDCLLYTSRCV